MPDEKTPQALLQRSLNIDSAIKWIKDSVRNHVGSANEFRVGEGHICAIHSLCMAGLLPRPGFYREEDLEPFKKHQPPTWQEIPGLMRGFVQEINSMWNEQNTSGLGASVIYIGTYAIWRLNWIHPFENGNGRTSRLFSYFLMNMKVGHVFPGKPGFLLPEQLGGKRRDEYVQNLQLADSGDLRPMFNLFSDALRIQLSNI